MERFHLYRPPGAGGAFMAAADDGPWVRRADAQAAIDAANQRAAEAEQSADERGDAMVALNNALVECRERIAALTGIVSSETNDVSRRLALAVAEVRAWRRAEHLRIDEPHAEFMTRAEARRATDSDPVLSKMIGGGE